MRKANVFMHGKPAGILEETVYGKKYSFIYLEDYKGPSVSRTMPAKIKDYHFDNFPAFFDGLLPEGFQLEGLLRARKIDRYDYLSQLIAVGGELVGAVTVEEIQ